MIEVIDYVFCMVCVGSALSWRHQDCNRKACNECKTLSQLELDCAIMLRHESSFSNTQGHIEGIRGHNALGAKLLVGTKKSKQCRKYFNTVDLLLKHLKFKHGGAKLVSFPRFHLTTVRSEQMFS